MLITPQKRLTKKLNLARKKYRELLSVYYSIINDHAVINPHKETVGQSVDLLEQANSNLQNIGNWRTTNVGNNKQLLSEIKRILA